MKVTYILDVFPKISETFILNAIVEMQKKGVLIEVFAFSRGNEDKIHPKVKEVKRINYFPEKSFRRKYAHLYWLFRNPIKYIKTLIFALRPQNEIKKLFKKRLYNVILIKKSHPDHIHAHFGRKASNMAMLTHLLTGISYTFTTHRYDIFEKPPSNYRIKSKLAKKHITISQYNKRYIVDKFGVNENEIDVIHSAVDFDQNFPPTDCKDKNIIISITRLMEHKGLDNLIRACSELKKQGIVFQCLIVGEGPERKNLESLIKELGLAKEVELLGSKTHDEVFELLSRAKVKVLPSRSEGIPNTLMEAMAMKVPVIGPKVTGIHELVEDGKCGFLVPTDDIDMLVKKIKILLIDENLRKSFAENGYKKVLREFNLKIETDKLLRLWKC